MTRDEMAIDDDALAPAATGTDVTADGPGTEGANEPEPHPSAAWSEEELQAHLAKADEFKVKGNELFKAGQYMDASVQYQFALDEVPPKHAVAAIYYNNLAACHKNLDEHSEAVECCTRALEIDPKYLKALVRRAQCREASQPGEFAAMSGALEDWNKVLEHDPSHREALAAQRRLAPLVAAEQERLKNEMLGKLKDIGNSILGKFGLSLDNFKLQQDASTGSYSVQFNNGGAGGASS